MPWYKIIGVAVLAIMATVWHWSGWLAATLMLLIIIDPKERWDELLDAIKNRNHEPS